MKTRTATASIALAAIVATTACSGGVLCDVEIFAISSHKMPDLDIQVGDTVATPLEDHFSIPRGCAELSRKWGDTLFTPTSSDPAVAVSIADDLTTLLIAAVEATDSARVTVHYSAYRSDFQTDFYEFVVRVRPAGR